MSNVWHYSKNGQQHGPVSAAQLKQLATSGGFGPDDLVWQEGMPSWVPAKQVKGLFTAPTSGDKKATPSPPPLPQSAQPAPGESLPQVQVKVNDALKEIGNAIKGVATSEQVKAAGEQVKSAAGKAVAGVGEFIRSDAVQTQAKAARNFWSTTPVHIKALVIGGPIAGLLLMSCCGGCLIMGGGGASSIPSTSSSQTKPKSSKPGKTSPAYDDGYEQGRSLARTMYGPIEQFKLRLSLASSLSEKRSILDAIKSQLDQAKASLERYQGQYKHWVDSGDGESATAQTAFGLAVGFWSYFNDQGVDLDKL